MATIRREPRIGSMKLNVVALGLLIIVLWGVWGFAAKLARDRIELQVLIWSALFSNLVFICYLAWTGELWPLKLDPAGIGFGAAVGLTAAAGSVLFYRLLATEPASLIVPLTSLYPAVTAILGIMLLREAFTLDRVIGVTLAVLAIFFLSR